MKGVRELSPRVCWQLSGTVLQSLPGDRTAPWFREGCQRQGCSTSGGHDMGKGAFRAFVAKTFLLKIVKPAISSNWYGSDQCLTSDCSSDARLSGFQAGR